MTRTFGLSSVFLLSIAIAVVSVRFLFAPLAEVMPHMAHYLPALPLPLYGHLIFGPLALVLMPFQFWTRLRTKAPVLHRWMGRLYALAILVAAVSALAMLPVFQGTRWAEVGFAALALAWIGTTGVGVMAARRRDFARHGRWMLRSATLTFAAVTLRLIMALLMAAGWSVTQTYDVTAWSSWVLPLIVVEMWRGSRSKKA